MFYEELDVHLDMNIGYGLRDQFSMTVKLQNMAVNKQ